MTFAPHFEPYPMGALRIGAPVAQVRAARLPDLTAARHVDEAMTSGPSAADILASARQEARDIQQQAVVEAQQLRERATQQGYEAGHRHGLEQADTETLQLLELGESICSELAIQRDRILARAERDIVELSLHVAKVVLRAEIKADPELVVGACRDAMQQAFQREQLVVRAHPDDVAILEPHIEELRKQVGRVQSLTFTTDPDLERGSLMVRSDAGEIDATVESKLRRCADALAEQIEQRGAEASL